jgi:hypothetical protein
MVDGEDIKEPRDLSVFLKGVVISGEEERRRK